MAGVADALRQHAESNTTAELRGGQLSRLQALLQSYQAACKEAAEHSRSVGGVWANAATIELNQVSRCL